MGLRIARAGRFERALMLFSVSYQVAAVPLFLSSLLLLGMFAVFIQRGPTDFTVIMALGAAAWAIGNALLALGVVIPYVVPWWAAFLILTIAGERIELAASARGPKGRSGSPSLW